MKLGICCAVVLAMGMVPVSAGAQMHDPAAMTGGQTPVAEPAAAAKVECNCPCCKKMRAQTSGAKPMEASMPSSSAQVDALAMDHSHGMGGMQCPMMQDGAVPAGVLRIRVDGKATDWKLADLATLPHLPITLMNGHTKTRQSFRGVPLMELLKKAGVPEKPHGKDLALYLVAVGSDGYKAVLSVAEANPDVHEGTVLVADQLDGNPLAEQGPLMLVVAGETRPARWVRNLVEVRVARAE